MTRAEHVKWAKNRALEILKTGDRKEAITSMMSDLGKHEETVKLIESLGMIGMFEIMNGNNESAKRFIEGFAE